VGTAPAKEQCAAYGFPSYDAKVNREMDKWEAQLMRTFPDCAKYGKFVRVQKLRQFGQEWQLRFRFKREDKDAEDFSKFLLKNLPTCWTTKEAELHFIPDIVIRKEPKLEEEDDLDPFKF
jgi:hypothetical protein